MPALQKNKNYLIGTPRKQGIWIKARLKLVDATGPYRAIWGWAREGRGLDSPILWGLYGPYPVWAHRGWLGVGGGKGLHGPLHDPLLQPWGISQDLPGLWIKDICKIKTLWLDIWDSDILFLHEMSRTLSILLSFFEMLCISGMQLQNIFLFAIFSLLIPDLVQ